MSFRFLFMVFFHELTAPLKVERCLLLLFPGFCSPREALLLFPGFFFPRRNSSFVLGVLSPKVSWGGRCCRACQRIVPRGFVPQGKLGRPMLPRSPVNCASGFLPPREAGAADVSALASELFLVVSPPKGSWGGVNDATLTSG